MRLLAPIMALLAIWPIVGVHGQVAKKTLTIDMVVNEGALVSPGITSVAWHPSGNQITYIRTQGSGKGAVKTLRIYDVGSKSENLLFDPTGRKEKIDLPSYQWSPQGDCLLLQGENDLWLLEIKRGQLGRLTNDPEEEELPTFSPTGDRVAFVKKSNLSVLDLKTRSAKKLTTDGNETVLNGKLDWVYEEELANRSTGRAYEWSPDGRRIAFLRLDDSPVPEYPITDFLSVHAQVIRQRFPQPGDPNPIPSFHVVSVDEGEARTYTFPLESSQVEYIAPTFSWTPDSSTVSFLTLNRAQNELTVHLWNPVGGSDRELLVEKDPYWINSLEPPRFLEDSQRFLWLSERDGWLHLHLYSRDGKLEKQLTRGSWMIDRPFSVNVPMVGVDEKGGWVYFVATEKDPRERHLYRVGLDGGSFERLSREAGTHTLGLSPNGRFLIDNFSTADEPPEPRLLGAEGNFVALLDKPEDHLAEYALARTEFVELKAADGASLYARLVKPGDFDPRRKYPVIIEVYGGPHGQVVQNKWGVTSLLDQLLAQQGYLVWSLDNRGSWGRGHAWEAAVFKDLGRRELDDQLAGVAYLKSLPFVDSTRFAIWGWSYGGYFTLYALTHTPDAFQCGVAGAPVTDWKLYDSIYTERYMRTPQENPDGYKNASPLEAAGKLRAKLLLIHGTADDNVHMQNTINFINALVESRRPFELYVQPGQKHGFRGEVVRTYLYERLLEFFRDCR